MTELGDLIDPPAMQPYIKLAMAVLGHKERGLSSVAHEPNSILLTTGNCSPAYRPSRIRVGGYPSIP
jgi:hypothetical protein